MKSALLVTGPPRCGKTTLIRQATLEHSGKACGFYTEEMREGGERTGFRLITLHGASIVLAHNLFNSPYRVGKYGVDIEALEKVGAPSLLAPPSDCDLVVIDEIGKMELLSIGFRNAVVQALDSGRRLLGAVLFHHHAWADVIKARPEVRLVMLNRSNYGAVLNEVRLWLKETA